MARKDEIEADVCAGFRRFEQEFMGRAPRQIDAHLWGDLLVVRLTGLLTVAEQQLAQPSPTVKGRDLIKQVRAHLLESARPILEEIIRQATGVAPVSLHHDISTVTGEKIVVFTLAASPLQPEANAC